MPQPVEMIEDPAAAFKPTQLIEAGGSLYALCRNGTVWRLTKCDHWVQMPLIGFEHHTPDADTVRETFVTAAKEPGPWLWRQNYHHWWLLVDVDGQQIVTGKMLLSGVPVDDLGGYWRKPSEEEIKKASEDSIGRLLLD